MNFSKEQWKKIKKIAIAVFGALVAMGAFTATVTTIMWKRVSRKLKSKTDGQNNMVYIAMFWRNRCTINEDTNNAYLSTACGAIKAEMPEVPDHDVNVDVYACLGRITLWVPENVKVVCDLELPCGGSLCEELSEANERDDMPVVNVTGRVCCGTLNIRRLADSEPDCE
ncbi:MAG: hypothetical protein J6Y67_02855 [Lachnospiraceae bacterium]|nr:hypothetical protein [Lachnospiraceae bacterium]